MQNDLSTLGKRIRYLRKQQGLSQAQLAEMIDADQSVIGNIERRDSKTSTYTESLAKALKVDYVWLSTGTGDDTTRPASVENNRQEYIVIGGASEYDLVDISYIDLASSCGGGYANGDHPEQKGMLGFTVEFLRENDLPISGDGLLLMHACGESMGYTIPHGTMLLVNTKENTYDSFISGKIYIFNAEGEMICKRAFKNLDGTVTLVSDNPDKSRYPDQIINKTTFSNFNLFARVRYTFAKM